MSDVIGDVFVITCGTVIVIVILAVSFLKLRSAERRMHESSYKLRVYTDLLNAVTKINLSGGDSYKMDIAKKNLALTLNRLNLIASSGVSKVSAIFWISSTSTRTRTSTRSGSIISSIRLSLKPAVTSTRPMPRRVGVPGAVPFLCPGAEITPLFFLFLPHYFGINTFT